MPEDNRIEQFEKYRESMNEIILKRCVEAGLGDEEIWEAMSVGLIVGGSVLIPHLRRAVDTLKQLRAGQK